MKPSPFSRWAQENDPEPPDAGGRRTPPEPGGCLSAIIIAVLVALALLVRSALFPSP